MAKIYFFLIITSCIYAFYAFFLEAIIIFLCNFKYKINIFYYFRHNKFYLGKVFFFNFIIIDNNNRNYIIPLYLFIFFCCSSLIIIFFFLIRKSIFKSDFSKYIFFLISCAVFFILYNFLITLKNFYSF